MGRPIIDLTGLRVGRLVVVEQIPRITSQSITKWRCRCDCGNMRVVAGSDLRRCSDRKNHRPTRSCGCLSRELASRRLVIHGRSGDRLFKVWSSMIARCTSETHKAYRNYGGRGITVCHEWKTFQGFLDDMEADYVIGLTLERRDNNKGYSRDNCYWTTKKIQNNNRRDNVIIPTPKGKMTMAQAVEQFGIARATLRDRIKRGWPMVEWFTPPK